MQTNGIIMTKYRNKYRIASTRLQDWDYGWNGAYFVTICTHNREHFFGQIIDGIIQVSTVGVIADILWHEIKNHTKNIELESFVVMPNHIHGILILNNNATVETGHAFVETGHALSLQPSQQPQTIGQKRFQNIGKNSISSIIGSYKSASTKHAHRSGHTFAWQSRFYDHIIRNEQSFNRITEYIISNPKNWDNDKLNQYHKVNGMENE